MKKKDSKTDQPEADQGADFLDYDPKQDIYNQGKRVGGVNTDDFTPISENESPEKRNEKDFDDDKSGADLDVPGAELDDREEEIGEEDEENNYYSLGGDNHEDLEEHK